MRDNRLKVDKIVFNQPYMGDPERHLSSHGC